MNQIIRIDDGSMEAMRDAINSSLVKLVCHLQNDEDEPVIILPGIPIVSENEFCHIIALKKVLCSEVITRREVVFPDPGETRKEISMEDIKIQGNFAEICLHLPSKLVDSVKFSAQKISDDEEVILVGFSPRMSVAWHLTHGLVKIANKDHFNYECSPFLCYHDGEPIFNSRGELVGICFQNEGVTSALNVDAIAKDVSKFYEGIRNKDLHEIQQCIKDQEMNKFGIRTKRKTFGKYT